MSQEHAGGRPPEGSGTAMGLGIAGLVIGIVALLFSFVPCLGMFAVWPGMVAVVLAAVGLGLSIKANKVSGLSIAALSVSIVACGIAGWQYYTIKKGLEKAGKEIKEEFKKGIDEAEKRRQEAERKRKEAQEQNKTNTP